MNKTRRRLILIDLIGSVLIVGGVWILRHHFSDGLTPFNFVGLICVMAGLTAWFQTSRARRTVQYREAQAAEASRKIRQNIFSDQVHEYRLAAPDEFPDLDHYFYDNTQQELQNNGFTFLGNAENLTLTRLVPARRTFTRALVNADGRVTAGIRHSKSAKMRNTPDRRVVELHSEFSDGSFFITNNTSNVTVNRSSPRLNSIFCAVQTPLEELLRLHLEAIAGYLVAHPGVTVTRINSADDYIHLEMRLHGVITENEKAKGFTKPNPKLLAAQTMLQQQKAIYSERPHEYRLTGPADFPNLDQAFYDRFRDFFVGQGFRFVFDRENMTLSGVFPHMRTFTRSIVSNDGTIAGCAYHVKLPQREARTIELESELSDGTFLDTTTAANTTLPFPGIERQNLPSTTPPEELLRIHLKRLADALASRPSVTATKISSDEDLMNFWERGRAIKVRHKQATGMVSAEDMKKIKGRQLLANEQAIIAEVEKIKQAEQIDSGQ